MVLTRSMATTNVVQSDEPPRPTALERQVQTLAAVVERLTKQNHDLEEQLRQRNLGHNIQKENQGDSSERRGLEKQEDSNEPSRTERRNSSMPSLTDATPPPILAEMQAMKEQMEVMMNALKGRVSSDLDDLGRTRRSLHQSTPVPCHRSSGCRRLRATTGSRTR